MREYTEVRRAAEKNRSSRPMLVLALLLFAFAMTGCLILQNENASDSCIANQYGPLSGKVIFLAGDSRSSDDYSFYRDLLQEKSGALVYTGGASGRTAAYNASDEYFKIVAATPHQYSIWLVGGNDDGHPGSIGTFSSDTVLADQGEPVVKETDITTDYHGQTFIQAIDHIMRKYKEMCSSADQGAEMLFCTDLPQQRVNGNTEWSRQENWERKRFAILECCEKNGVDCIDLYSLCQFDMSLEPYYVEPTDKENDNGYYYMDGLHPNRAGFDKITDLILDNLCS